MNSMISSINLTIVLMSCCSQWASVPEIVLALVGVCTTLIVGFNIVGALRIQEIEKHINKLSDLEANILDMKDKTNIALHLTWGIALFNAQPRSAIKEFLKAFQYSLEANDFLRAHTCLNNLEKMVKNAGSSNNNENKISIEIPQEIKNNKNYKVFEKELNRILGEINKWKE